MDEIYWCRMWDTARGAEGRAIEGPITYRADWSFYDLLAFMHPFSSANSELAFRIWWLSSLKIQNIAYANAHHILPSWPVAKGQPLYLGMSSVWQPLNQPSQNVALLTKMKRNQPVFLISVLTPDLSLSARGHFRHNLDPQPPSDWA